MTIHGGDHDGEVNVSAPTEPLPTFTPEFSGTRKAYQPRGGIEARCNHGLVVSALADELTERGFNVGNDRARDLYVISEAQEVKILFEVKTDLSTGSIYGAVGQLMLHGATQQSVPRRIAVFPGTPDDRTKSALNKIGISILVYSWEDEKPQFIDIEGTL